MFLKYFYKFLLIALLIFVASCSSNNAERSIKPKELIPLEKLYTDAYNNFENGNYNVAAQIFEIVERDYSYTEWASRALLMRAYLYYETGNYVLALTNLQRFKLRHSGSNNMQYVEYLIGICMFEQINFVSLSQENTDLALRQFQKVILNYPNSAYATDAKFKIDLITEQFAAKEMYITRYYIKREKWLPALYRLNNVFKNYQTTIFIEEALHRLVEIHYKIGNMDTAKKYASILGYNYNDSDWYKKSYNIVEGANIPLEKARQKKSLKERLKKLIQLQ
jgi:outer membrane protein assembly factor BamD|tara:strand:+ start:102 stop:938 length:837 start_codon:yes stop_codon:yes gene_type:complete